MQNTAKKIEDLNPSGLSYFKRHMYREAIGFWNEALQENALDKGQIEEIKKAKNWFISIQTGKEKKEDIVRQLNTLLDLYHIEFIESFREQNGKELSPASDIIIDEKGNILVIDEFNHRIQIYNNEKKQINCIGEKSKEAGQFYYPRALARDSKGNIYVADCWNHRIQKFSPDFKFIAAFGSYGEKEEEFNEPYDIAIDKKDRLFIADRCNHRIQVFDSDGKFLYSFGQRGTILEEGLAEFYETPKKLFSIPAFEFPTKIALDSKENLYVVDSGNCRIQKLSLSGEFLSSFGEKGEGKDRFQYPFDIAIDESDQIFVSDTISNRIYQFTPEGYFVLSLKGDDEDDSAHASLFHSPSAITFDKKGRLVIAEDLSTEIRILKLSHKSIENIYREKLLLAPEDSQTHCAFADFYCENERWNEAVEEYVKALDHDKENLDIKLKLAKCLLKADFSENHIKYLDLIIDLSDQNTEELEKEILKLYEEKYQFERELMTKQWESEWEILVNNRYDSEVDVGLGSKNRKINRSIREKLINYKKLISRGKEYISLSFQLCEQENFSNKERILIENITTLLKKNLNSLLKDLGQKSHLSIFAFLDIKKDIIRHVYEFVKNPDFIVDQSNLAEYFIDIYLNLNKTLLENLKERQKIYIDIEREINFYEGSEANYNPWINLKRLYHELYGLTSSISFQRARIVEIISILKNKILKEFQAFTKKSHQSFLSAIEEINWLVWEDPKFQCRTEDYIINNYDTSISPFQDVLIRKMKKEKGFNEDFFDKACTILDKILLYDNPHDFNVLVDIIEKEMQVLYEVSENYKKQYKEQIEKHVGLEYQKLNKKSFLTREEIKLQAATEIVNLKKHLIGLKLWQNERTIIFLWKRIMGIIQQFLDSGISTKELQDIRNQTERFKKNTVDRQNKLKEEILISIQKSSYNSEDYNIYQLDLERQKDLIDYTSHKLNLLFQS